MTKSQDVIEILTNFARRRLKRDLTDWDYEKIQWVFNYYLANYTESLDFKTVGHVMALGAAIECLEKELTHWAYSRDRMKRLIEGYCAFYNNRQFYL